MRLAGVIIFWVVVFHVGFALLRSAMEAIP